MMTKAELRQFRRDARAVKRLEERQAQIRAQIDGLRAVVITDLPKGTPPPADERIAAALDSLERINALYLAKIAALTAKKAEIEIMMDVARLTATEQEVIRLYYFDVLKWDEVSVVMKYSVDHVFRLHGYAVRKLASK